ncbi:MAG: AAA family ATPase [Lachnospiraceae bacterium]
MAANMLAAYYDRSENTKELFQNLAISKANSYKENLNQYDVIKINMQEFLSMSETMEDMLEILKNYLVSDFEETYPEVRFRDKKESDSGYEGCIFTYKMSFCDSD